MESFKREQPLCNLKKIGFSVHVRIRESRSTEQKILTDGIGACLSFGVDRCSVLTSVVFDLVAQRIWRVKIQGAKSRLLPKIKRGKSLCKLTLKGA